MSYSNPPPDVESDCIGEVQVPSNVEEDHMHAVYGGTNLVGRKVSIHFRGWNEQRTDLAHSIRKLYLPEKGETMPARLVEQGLKLADPRTASQPIKYVLTLLPVINVFRAQANFRSEPDQGNADSEVSKC